MLNEIKRILDLKPKEKEIGFVEKISTIQKQRKKINTLELELDTLKEKIKSELYKKIIDKLDEPTAIVRLRKENKRLREKIKKMKEEINERRNK